MSQRFVITVPNEEQLKELVNLKRLCEIELGWKPPEEYLSEWIKAVHGIYCQDPKLVRVALSDNKIVGYCISVKKLHNYEGVVLDVTWKNAYIWDLFVLKEKRKRGIGTALIKDTLAYFKELGIEKAFLLVNYWNEEARRLFEKLDFKLWSHLLVKQL